MARAVIAVGSLASLAFGAGLTLGQQDKPLAEVAKEDKERRSRQSAPAKVYTNDDLTHDRPDAAVSAPGGALASPQPSPAPGASASPPAKGRGQLEQEWRVRFANARRRVSDEEARCWREVVEPVLTDGGFYVPMRVKKFFESEELRLSRSALADLEEELRRSGNPPGWGRE
jgi:hypothetical protein